MKLPDKRVVKRLSDIKKGELDPIVLAINDAKKCSRPMQEYIDHISPASLRELTDEQLELLTSGDITKVVTANLDTNNPIAFLETANRYFSQFKLAEHNQQLFLFKIVNIEKKILSALFDADYKKVLVREASRTWVKETGEPLPPNLASQMLQWWFNHADLIDIPEPMATAEDDVWCLHRSDCVPNESIGHPSWQRVLNRMTDPVAFGAWIAGVYYGWYKGRQMMWLHGPHGEDGKSAITSLIAKELFGPAHNAISNASFSGGDNRFITSFFENAALVIYPDASNRKCLMGETFKTIASAGSDPVLIERKGKQAYTSTLKARMWICSNYAPEITNDNFAVSRLLYIKIDKMIDETPDPTVIDRLRAELPGFLAFAIKSYRERCVDNYKIVTNESSQEAVTALTSSFYDDYEIIFGKYWQQATTVDRVEASKVRDAARGEGIRSNVEFGQFVEWMEKYKDVSKRKISAENGKVFYYGICRLGAVNSSSVKPNF
jgi:hypothetical protein